MLIPKCGVRIYASILYKFYFTEFKHGAGVKYEVYTLK